MNSDLNELDPDLLSLHLTDVVKRLTNNLSNEEQEYKVTNHIISRPPLLNVTMTTPLLKACHDAMMLN